LVTRLSPTLGMMLPKAVLVCSMDMNSARESLLNAQVSTTCCPRVLITFTRWPAATRAAFPFRAGMVTTLVSFMGITPKYFAKIGLRSGLPW